MISERVKSFIEKYDLREPFIVGFSGGYDSMCLLDVLIKLNYLVIAVHLNHNWRGDESLNEEENCKKFAAKKGIKFYSETLSNDVAHTENAAREARYEFFKRCAKKYNSNVVFTAHNYDDNAETVLYRIVKGTGIIGLKGIEENRENLFYRPLLSTTREEIEKYCKENKLKPNNDSSNKDVKYKRNLIRNNIFPLLKEINPKVTKSLNSLSQIAVENAELLKNVEDDKYFIREILVENNLEYDRKKILEIKEFIDSNKNSKSGKKYSLSSDLWLYVNEKGVKVVSDTKKSNEKVFVNKVGTYKIDKQEFSIKKFSGKVGTFPKDSENKAFVCLDKINFEIRHRNNGDVIQPLGCNGSQKIKKYLNEKKIPFYKKDDLVLLCSGNEVLWVAGVGISDKIKVVDKPTHVLELRSNYE